MSSGAEHSWLLPRDVSATVEARAHVADVCAGLPRADVDIARLLVTELVANALQHGSGEVLLIVAREGSGVRVGVHDANPVLPVVAPRRELEERGWGLLLVAELSSSWGVTPREDGRPGKSVWFALS